MPADATARALRVGDVTVAPGESRLVRIPLPGRKADDSVPAWVAVGARRGPRVTVIAALAGYEALAAAAARRLADSMHPASIQGSLVVVPVLRPGGRFSAVADRGSTRGRWRFPGDAGGDRRAREAFALFSSLCVGSTAVLLLTAPSRDRVATLTVRGDLADPRVRRLAERSGAAAVITRRPVAGTLAAAAGEAGVVVTELRTRRADGDQPELDELDTVLRTMLAAAGVLGRIESHAPPRAKLFPRVGVLRAAAGGVLNLHVAPGDLVPRGAVVASIRPVGGANPVDLVSPREALILETTARTAARTGSTVVVLGRVRRGASARARAGKTREGAAMPGHAATGGRGRGSGPVGEPVLRVGWVENVALPSLGVERLRAKIDTGARTSALHVARMKEIGTTAGPHRRPILEVTVPAGGRRAARPVPVRVPVREYALVKDTSGRTERRPVIETTLRLGSIERRVRVTLTNRGDMLFPMLIGRTALGPGVLVDPARRCLLVEPPPRGPHPTVSTGGAAAPGPGPRARVRPPRVRKKAPILLTPG